jgi:aminoglycoside phosphotransferase family enzyme
MENFNSELEFHSRISGKIYRTLEEISDEGEDGSINTHTARRIIRLVKNFNFNRELMIERLKSGMITDKEFQKLLTREGQKCIDSINIIVADAAQSVPA